MNKPQLVVGIDPGLSGGIAVVNAVTGQAWVHNIPVETVQIDGKNRKRYHCKALLKLLRGVKKSGDIALVIVEQQRVYGCEGRKSAFTLGLGYGHLLMALEACNLPCRIVDPREWKREMSLTSDKELSRQTARDLYPDLAHDLRFKNSHGKAEGLLLARYGQEFLWTKTPHTKRKAFYEVERDIAFTNCLRHLRCQNN